MESRLFGEENGHSAHVHGNSVKMTEIFKKCSKLIVEAGDLTELDRYQRHQLVPSPERRNS